MRRGERRPPPADAAGPISIGESIVSTPPGPNETSARRCGGVEVGEPMPNKDDSGERTTLDGADLDSCALGEYSSLCERSAAP